MIGNNELRQNYWLLGIPLLLFVVLYFVLGDLSKSVLYLAILSGLGFISWILFFQLKWFYLLLIALIPFSQDLLLNDSAKINFPSELLLVVFVIYAFLFVKDYSSGLARLLKHPITILLVIDLIIGLLSALFSDFMDVGIKRVVLQSLFFLGFFVPIVLFKDIISKYYLWIVYALGLLPVMYFTLSMHIHHDFNPKVIFSICQPYFNDHTIYGACLAFIIPFLIIVNYKSKLITKSVYLRSILILVIILVLLSEFLALSRAAILSLIVALLFYLLLKLQLKFRYLVFGLGVIITVTLSFSDVIYQNILENEQVSNDGEITHHFTSVTNINSDASNLERINRWVCAYRMFEEKPLLGFGPGVYQFEYNRFQSFEYKTYISTNMGDKGNAHSEYLSALSEKGILGFITFVLIVFISISIGMKNHYHLKEGLTKSLNLAVLLGLVTFFFHAIFNAFLDQSKMAFLVYGALATIVIINMQLKHEPN